MSGLSRTQKILDAGELREEFFLLTPAMKMGQLVLKRRNVKFRRRGVKHKEEHNTLHHNCIYSRLAEDEPSGSINVEHIKS